jgi:alpha-tubulin suppressor-like RCC1 family protein
VMVACGARHSVVVSAEGRVWTFGDGAYGCQGLNDGQDNLQLRTRDRLVPTLLTAEVFEHSKFVTVAAGGFHTIGRG